MRTLRTLRALSEEPRPDPDLSATCWTDSGAFSPESLRQTELVLKVLYRKSFFATKKKKKSRFQGRTTQFLLNFVLMFIVVEGRGWQRCVLCCIIIKDQHCGVWVDKVWHIKILFNIFWRWCLQPWSVSPLRRPLPDITTISKVANNGLVVGMEPVLWPLFWPGHNNRLLWWQLWRAKKGGLRSVALE